jgi:hypothetical protein
MIFLLGAGGCYSMSTGDYKQRSESPAHKPSTERLLERLEAIAASSGTATELKGLQLQWSDMQGLFGGTTLQVKGDGASLVVINSSGTSVSKPGTIAPGHAHALLRDLLQLGVFAATSSVGPGVPDEVRLRVSVTLGDETLEVWRWQSDISPGKRDPIGESMTLFYEAISPRSD